MENKTVRKRAIRKRLDILLDDVLAVLETDDGKTFEEKKTLILHMLREKEEHALANEPADTSPADRNILQLKHTFWSSGERIDSSNGIILRKVTASDRENFLALHRKYAAMQSVLEQESYCNSVWEEHTGQKTLMFSIEQDNVYIGYCGIQDLSSECPEISIELQPDKVSQGIGFLAVSAMLNELKSRLDRSEYRVRIEPTNYASQGLFEKLGATPNGISELWVHDKEELDQLENENLQLINDALVAVAEKFSVQPRQLLSHVLEYKLAWQ